MKHLSKTQKLHGVCRGFFYHQSRFYHFETAFLKLIYKYRTAIGRVHKV